MVYIIAGNTRGPQGVQGPPGDIDFKETWPSNTIANWYGTANAGIYQVNSQAEVDSITDRPVGAKPGNVQVFPGGAAASLVQWREYGELGRVWERSIGTGLFASQWEKRRGNKRIGEALTLPGASTLVDTRTDVGHALPYTPPVAVQRWRLHIRNFNDRASKAYAGSLTLKGMGIGEMAATSDGSLTNQWQSTKGRPVILNDGQTTSSSAAEFVSPWVEDYPLDPTKNYVIFYGYTGAAQDNHAAHAGGWSLPSSASVFNATMTGTQVSEAPLDIWLELEVPEDTPAYAYFGDSLTAGQSSTYPVFDSWAKKHARAHGAIPVMYAQSGGQMSEFMDGGKFIYQKYINTRDLISKPDRLYWSMGSNDLWATGADLATMITRFHAVYKLLTAVTSKNVVFTTILPRHNASDPAEAERKQWNDWLRDNGPSYGLLTLETAAAVEDATGNVLDIRWTASPTDIHLNTAGYARFASVVG
ncbi:SGNH/GDSL hydrolase family protein [Glutamicibacter arilaitensis]|uniref:SGNH/GDSL hydrolase family protein n=1 Tax=Glutamicibacter arilaitensis TaxID=256701 RepID=UPI003FD50B60